PPRGRIHECEARGSSDRAWGDVPSSDDAEHFAADTGGARLAIGHHALRRRHDRDAEAVHHRRDVVLAFVDAKAGLRHALDLLDDRAPRVIAERDLELGLARLVAADLEAVDVA